MIEYKIILAVGSSRDVYVCSWVVDMHDVVYYVCTFCLICKWWMDFLLFITVAIVCVVSIHINWVSVRLRCWAELLGLTQIFLIIILSHRQFNCDVTSILSTIDYKKLDLFWKHCKTFVFWTCSVSKVYVLRIYYYCRWRCSLFRFFLSSNIQVFYLAGLYLLDFLGLV